MPLFNGNLLQLQALLIAAYSGVSKGIANKGLKPDVTKSHPQQYSKWHSMHNDERSAEHTTPYNEWKLKILRKIHSEVGCTADGAGQRGVRMVRQGRQTNGAATATTAVRAKGMAAEATAGGLAAPGCAHVVCRASPLRLKALEQCWHGTLPPLLLVPAPTCPSLLLPPCAPDSTGAPGGRPRSRQGYIIAVRPTCTRCSRLRSTIVVLLRSAPTTLPLSDSRSKISRAWVWLVANPFAVIRT